MDYAVLDKLNKQQIDVIHSFFKNNDNILCNDISFLFNPLLSAYNMEILCKALVLNINVFDLTDYRISYDVVYKVINARYKGIDISGIDFAILSAYEVDELILLKKRDPNIDLSNTPLYKEIVKKAYVDKQMKILEIPAYIEKYYK